MKKLRVVAAAALLLTGAAIFAPSDATSSADCSAKYKAAKTAGTLNGMKYSDFRKAQCSTTAATASAAAPDAAPAKSAEPAAAKTEKLAEPAAPKTPPPAGVVFPKAVDPKYASETPGKARMHTCLDQYKAAKASNSLGGMKWIQSGGGYYSACNAKLKG
jgi:hypothetical protein